MSNVVVEGAPGVYRVCHQARERENGIGDVAGEGHLLTEDILGSADHPRFTIAKRRIVLSSAYSFTSDLCRPIS
jgi:hypothetical protein